MSILDTLCIDRIKTTATSTTSLLLPLESDGVPDLTKPSPCGVSDAVTTDDDESLASAPFLKGDSGMVTRFLNRLTQPPSLSENVYASRLVHRVVRMLRTCKYDQTDIAAVLAMTALHHNLFVSTLSHSRTAANVSTTERTFILLAQTYIAHCVVLDECCSINNWHRYLFSTYCDLRSLNHAIARILKRMNWQLEVDLAQLLPLAEHIQSGEHYISLINTTHIDI